MEIQEPTPCTPLGRGTDIFSYRLREEKMPSTWVGHIDLGLLKMHTRAAPAEQRIVVVMTGVLGC